MNSLYGLKIASIAPSHHLLAATSRAGYDSLLFGFRGGPEAMTNADPGQKKTRYLRVALDWIERGPLANEEGLAASNHYYRLGLRLSVSGITVPRDGIAEQIFGSRSRERVLRQHRLRGAVELLRRTLVWSSCRSSVGANKAIAPIDPVVIGVRSQRARRGRTGDCGDCPQLSAS